MTKYIIRRLLQAIPTLFGICLLSFMLLSAAPGGPTTALFAGDPGLSASQRQRLEAQFGANDPWPLQFLYWMVGDDWVERDLTGDGEPDAYGVRKGILRGDFGISYSQGRRPVTQIIVPYIVPTLELTVSAFIIGIGLGLPIGILAAIRRGGVFDNTARVWAVISNAMPNFWLGLILILIFASGLGWLPISGRGPRTLMGLPPLIERWHYLILPTLTLGTGAIAAYSRYMRASMLDVIGQDYIRTARAKGLASRFVWYRHAARNAMIPIATFLGPAITGLLGGAVITETIFAWPGLGRLAVQAVNQRDFSIVMITVLMGAVATIIGYILSDILYALIDPRIRFS
jgi:peptide/nickel transport system permease protein